MPNRLRRSILYMPGSNDRALKKAMSLDTDVIVMDLEDAVGMDDKVTARLNIARALNEYDYGHRERIIRINTLDSQWGQDDLRAIAKMKLDGVLVPKVNSADDIKQVWDILHSHGQESLAIWAMMETPMAMLNAKDIASVVEDDIPLSALVIGPNDLAKETKAQMDQERTMFRPWFMNCVAAARAYGLTILDGVYNNFKDLGGFTAECHQGRMMGMDGKSLIHPSQIDICNDIFSPNQDELDHAKSIVDAFNKPENNGKGVIQIEGEMVEKLHADMAQTTLDIANLIASRTGKNRNVQ